MYLILTKGRTKDTLQFKKRNNKVHSPTSYGHDIIGNNLVLDERKTRLLNKMIKLRSKSFSYGKISKYLIRNRHRSESSGKWSRHSALSLLNPRDNY
tara:strand:- start:44 stop:334 length:291 start_codon:yes stop_codon:yes gene_type:complete